MITGILSGDGPDRVRLQLLNAFGVEIENHTTTPAALLAGRHPFTGLRSKAALFSVWPVAYDGATCPVDRLRIALSQRPKEE